MSNNLVDPRTKSKYTFLFINSNNIRTYTPRESNLLQLDEYFDTLYNTCVLFKNEITDTNKLDNYSITIYDTINNIVNNQLKPCANSTNINKCDCISIDSCTDNDICAYTLEVQSLLADYINIILSLTTPDIKVPYNFLLTVLQNYTAAAVTIPINKELGKPNSYNLCGGTLFITSTVTDPTLIAKYNAIISRTTKKIIQVETNIQNVNTQNTIINVVIGLVIFIVIIVILYFSWKSVSNIIKGINKKKS